MEVKVGELVAVYWSDIQGYSEWTDVGKALPLARCVDYGRVTHVCDDRIEVSGSMGDHDGDVQKSSTAVIPRGCVELVVRIREPRAPAGWPVWRG